MANAKKCDRCGAYYMGNFFPLKDEFDNECNAAKIKLIGDNRGVIEEYDLCNHCVAEFIHFMNPKKEDSDEVSEV